MNTFSGQLEGYGDSDANVNLGAFPHDKDVPPSEENAELRRQLNNMGGCKLAKVWIPNV